MTTVHTDRRVDVDDRLPKAVGRYTVESILGAGGFGAVYLAFDSELRRKVAIKVPRAQRSGHDEFRVAFMAEARVLARLDHPHIVPIYDVGSCDEYPCFIVSKFIDGADLHARLSTLSWDWAPRAELVATIAEALHSAHLAGLVHRDVKPSNVLLDHADKAYLADFGLALSDEDYQHRLGGARAGTLLYMSPEQVRGEGHLVDGRADIFSLGVLMYELLTGVRPFTGDTREQLMHNILERDARPLRERSAGVPRELERICLRALERRTSQRYSTALDFAEELRAFVAAPHSLAYTQNWISPKIAAQAAVAAPGPAAETHAGQGQSATSHGTSSLAPRIVPKGLRAFDADDADFFLQILPGPKDRFGMPESLRFWKHRIESDSPDETFRAGVLYGPSGCGKSSLIRAGLLPHLASRVVPIVVSATPHDLEQRLHNGLLAACPELRQSSPAPTLNGLLQSLRLHGPPASSRTILLVIDQFEQWLSAHGEQVEHPLVQALRQCDGLKIKCLFLVRNDFWMSISRVMETLESPILQGRNSAAVELFDRRHAERVLFAFGHAYGALPEKTSQLSPAQQAFLRQSVDQLAEDGRVICVRLAVFAQMLRDKPWEPRTLTEFGGVSGLGARFLEETFCGSAAPPDYKRLQVPARAVLNSLLPTPGSDIRGAMLSEVELAAAAGAGISQHDFQRLLQMLNDDLRLLTPTDALGDQLATAATHPAAASSSAARPAAEMHYYQLTHDYLVPSLRTWLSAKQRESAQGRGLLCLAERTALWEINHEARQLPSWGETLRILVWTRPSQWNASQSRMMRQAKRLRITQTLFAALLLLALAAAGWTGRRSLQHMTRQQLANGLVEQLETARLGDMLPIVHELDNYQPLGNARLVSLVDDPSADRESRFRGLLALSRVADAWTERLLVSCHDLSSDSLGLVRQRCQTFAPQLESSLQKHFAEAESPAARLRYAALLSSIDGVELEPLQAAAPELCEALLSEAPQELETFADYLSPLRAALLPALVEVFHDATRIENQRTAAARPLAKFADADLLAKLLLDATPAQHFLLMPAAAAQRESIVAQVAGELATIDADAASLLPHQTKRGANAVHTLLRLQPDHAQIDRHLSSQRDPTLRTTVIVQCYNYGVPLSSVWEAWSAATTPTARQALILACEPYHAHHRSLDRVLFVSEALQELLRSELPQCERSAAQWVLRRWNLPSPEAFTASQPPTTADSLRDWWLTPAGQTMVALRQPVYAAGPQALIWGREEEATAGPPVGHHHFAMAATEVTRAQLLQFQSDFRLIVQGEENEECPANRVDGETAMRYCRWLSEQSAVPDEQMCYPPVDEIRTEHMLLSPERLQRSGFRLPTEAEWEYACRAGSLTRWSHGENEQHLPYFAWLAVNSNSQLHPVAGRMPNAWGLFDMHGNAAEWCHPAPGATSNYAQRGGNYSVPLNALVSHALAYPSTRGFSFTGFRIAQTLPTPAILEESP